MSRLPRPYIPLAIRCMVATRQLYEKGINAGQHARREGETLKELLARLLWVLFGDAKLELHHTPSLVNRRRKRNGDYDPAANDYRHLEYMLEDAHDIETRVRGRHGQHSDLALARKNKRIARNRDPKHRKVKIPQRKNPWQKKAATGGSGSG